MPKKTSPKSATISLEIKCGGQKGRLTEVLSVGENRLKVSIASDSYDAQSHARVLRWDGTEWKLLHSLLSVKTKASYASGATAATFAADRAELLRVAIAILGT